MYSCGRYQESYLTPRYHVSHLQTAPRGTSTASVRRQDALSPPIAPLIYSPRALPTKPNVDDLLNSILPFEEL